MLGGVMSNRDEPVIVVRYASLTKLEPGKWKVECPKCNGVLPLTRHYETYELLDSDRCVVCAQEFRFSDIEAMREADHNGVPYP